MVVNPLEEQLFAAIEQGDLAMMLASPPVAFQRIFVDLTGSVTAALLLSACMQDQESRVGSNGWYTASAQHWERATGLSRKEQATARRVLREKHYMDERRTGYPAAFEVKIDFDEITRGLLSIGARMRSKQHQHPNIQQQELH